MALRVVASCSIADASCCCSNWVCSCSMRTSAIICISRRDCAAAGDDTARIAAATSPSIVRPLIPFILLCRDHEMRAPVLRPRRIVVSGIERELLAVADRLDLVRGHAERHHVVLRRQGPALAEGQVVFGGAALVAVSLDRD